MYRKFDLSALLPLRIVYLQVSSSEAFRNIEITPEFPLFVLKQATLILFVSPPEGTCKWHPAMIHWVY